MRQGGAGVNGARASLGEFPREAYADTKAALVAEEIRACLKDRAEEGLPLTIGTRSLSLV